MERDRKEGAWTDFNRLFGRYFLKGELQALNDVPQAVPDPDQGDPQGRLFSTGS
jgi:hypothetical protein